MTTAFLRPFFECAPYRLSGVVYGTLLNHRPLQEGLGEAMQQAPYKGAPQAPVLYVKPRNTLNHDGHAVRVPLDAPELQVGAVLGVVMARTATRLTRENAISHVAGYTVVNDVCVPHDSFYRPSIRWIARDGFCPISHRITPVEAVPDPDHLRVQVSIDGRLVHETTTGDRIRDVRQLLVDVTEFMTLQAGDVLTIGVSAGAPRAKAGQHVTLLIDGVGRLDTPFVSAQQGETP